MGREAIGVDPAVQGKDGGKSGQSCADFNFFKLAIPLSSRHHGRPLERGPGNAMRPAGKLLVFCCLLFLFSVGMISRARAQEGLLDRLESTALDWWHRALSTVTLGTPPAGATVEAPKKTEGPDAVKIGLFIVNLQDLNFVNDSFAVDFWIWADYRSDRIQPFKTMEFVNARTSTVSLPSRQEKSGLFWAQEKIQGVFRHQWNMNNFPFDRHVLSLIFEEGLEDTSRVVYVADDKASGIDKNIRIPGFRVTKVSIGSTERQYDSNFGDPDVPSSSKYTQLRANIELERDSLMLFIKLNAGIYVTFMVSMLCFLVLPSLPATPALLGSVLSTVVGAMFAAIINLRAVDTIIGRSESITLVDRIHFVSVLYFVVLGLAGVFVLTMKNHWKGEALPRFSRWAGVTYVASYVLINGYMIWHATKDLG
ncbi:MAG: hypothetical protein ABT940_07950 [Alphaproteobacteria bacterium]